VRLAKAVKSEKEGHYFRHYAAFGRTALSDISSTRRGQGKQMRPEGADNKEGERSLTRVI